MKALSCFGSIEGLLAALLPGASAERTSLLEAARRFDHAHAADVATLLDVDIQQPMQAAEPAGEARSSASREAPREPRLPPCPAGTPGPPPPMEEPCTRSSSRIHAGARARASGPEASLWSRWKPDTVTEKDLVAILGSIEAGCSHGEAALAAGVRISSLRRLKRANPAVATRLRQARLEHARRSRMTKAGDERGDAADC